MHQAALRAAHDLYLHKPRSRQILLEVHFVRPERGERLLAGEAERLAERFPVAGDAHALAAPARRRLDDHREADLFGDLEPDRKSTRLNSSHSQISYAVFCLKKKKKKDSSTPQPIDRNT